MSSNPWSIFYDDQPEPITPPAERSTGAELVKEKFNQGIDRGTEAWEIALAYLEELKDKKYILPWTSIDLPEENIPYVPSPNEPEQPALEDDDIAIPNFSATHPKMDPVDINNDDIPVNNIGDPPNVDFNYSEAPYTSTLLDALTAKLEADIAAGGTGLDADTEQAIWDRARARQEIEEEKAYDEALNFFASRGYSLPPGALVGALAEVRAQISRNAVDLNNDILVQQSNLAQVNTHFAINAAMQLEQTLIAYTSDFQRRAFEAAKAVVEYAVRIYLMRLDGYKALLEAYRTRAEVDLARVRANVAKFEGEVRLYMAEVERFKALLERAIAQAEINTKVNQSRVNLYEADTKKFAAELESLIQTYEAKVRQLVARSELSIKEAEIHLQAALAAYGLDTEVAKAIAQIASQMAASALSSINASASVGYAEGRRDSTNFGVSKSRQTSYNDSHSTSHNYYY